jgi:hypothetical protein
MTLAAGILALLTGLAYTGLGVITAYELARHGRRRGASYFGIGFLLMAATCGPHHLVHATHHLIEGEAATAPMLVALAVGFPPGAIFVLLRIEAMLGGRGDRLIAGTPTALAVVPWLMAGAAGATLFAALSEAGNPRPVALGANAVLLFNYVVVGAITFRTQLARRPALGGWSLSGISMAGVFATCGVSHLVAALATHTDWHALAFDLPGVPFSIYFLWVVHQLHRSSLRDWNRRPLVGRASRRARRSPWADGLSS